MPGWFRSAFATLLAVVSGASSAAAQPSAADVAYRFTYGQPGDETATIEIAWAEPLRDPAPLVMPRAIPMGYADQPYDAFVSEVEAFAGTAPLAAPPREEGPRWRLPAGATRVRYRVNLREMERDVHAASDASRVRDGYLGALGYSVFAFVDGFEDRPVRLRVEGPAGWPVFSTLAPRWPVATEPVEGRAPDFYALADAQVVLGPRATFRRLVESPAPLYLAVYAEGEVDLDRLGRLAATAYRRVTDYFGTVPFRHYTIHQELLTPLSPRHEYGMSMEHLDSSTYYLAASSGLTARSTADDDARVLYNFAHHISHAWVPKRAYGMGYFPFQWELAPVLDSIWFAEGFGQYAAIVAVAEGTPDPAAYREGMLQRRFRANVAGAPEFLRRMTLVDLSRVASTRYSEDFRTGRLVFSRGGLLAAALDDRIQAETKGARSLRDALRYLVAWAEREKRAFGNEELAGLIREATGVETGPIIEEWMGPVRK